MGMYYVYQQERTMLGYSRLYYTPEPTYYYQVCDPWYTVSYPQYYMDVVR